jgi:hypothetical protein
MRRLLLYGCKAASLPGCLAILTADEVAFGDQAPARLWREGREKIMRCSFTSISPHFVLRYPKGHRTISHKKKDAL